MKRTLFLLSICLVISLSTSAQLKVAIYPFLPRSEQFQQVLTDSWNQLNTGVQLQFVNYDCYKADPPDDLHVFVYDGIYLSYFQSKGYLSAIDTTQMETYQTFWPFARRAVKLNNVAYGVPYLSCANVYFYRKSDPTLNTGVDLNLNQFFDVIGAATYQDTIPPPRQGLLMDYTSSTTDACLYVSAWMNNYNNFTTNQPLPDYTQLDPAVVSNLVTYTTMAGKAQVSYSDPGSNRVTWFEQGRGRSMIGITENSASFSNAFLDSISFRMMPFAGTLTDTQNFYVDIAGINSKTPANLQPYAVMLVNLMTSYQVMYNSMIPSQGNPNPQFLIPARYNLLTDLIQVHPLYADILKLLVNHKPYQFLLPVSSRAWLTANKSGIRSILENGQIGQANRNAIKRMIKASRVAHDNGSRVNIKHRVLD